MAARKIRQYPGALGKPVPNKERPQNSKELTGLLEKRLNMLLDEYEIERDDPDRWPLLSLQLAFDHVPGFEFDRSGRKPKWTEDRDLRLFEDVNRYKKTGKKMTEICKLLSESSDYEETPDALKQRYYNLQKPSSVMHS